MNRAGGDRVIVRDDEDRRDFLRLLETITYRFDVEVHAYALMTNHYHLLMHCPKGRLSEAMQYWSHLYTKGFNERHGIDGPLFRGRYHSVPVETDVHLLEVSRYIHRNPLDIDRSMDLGGYPWSSYAAYVGRCRQPRFLFTDMVLQLSGGSTSYEQYVLQPRPSDKTGIAAVSQMGGALEAVPSARAGEPPSLGTVERAVTQAAGVPTAVVYESIRGQRNLPRLLTLLLGLEVAGHTPVELAARYGLTSPSSVSSSIARIRKVTENDPAVAALLQRAKNRLNDR